MVHVIFPTSKRCSDILSKVPGVQTSATLAWVTSEVTCNFEDHTAWMITPNFLLHAAALISILRVRLFKVSGSGVPAQALKPVTFNWLSINLYAYAIHEVPCYLRVSLAHFIEQAYFRQFERFRILLIGHHAVRFNRGENVT